MRIVVLLSGGMDSSVLAYDLRAAGHTVAALSVRYGQRHVRELESARAIAAKLGIEHRAVDVSSLSGLFGSCALTDPGVAVPHGHYAAETMKSTVVPNRNMIFLSLAAAWAIGLGFDGVAFAAHAGDHYIYPDCRGPFIEAFQRAVHLGNDRAIEVVAPYTTWDKARICVRGSELGVPFAETWSCYEGGQEHCGACGTCIERREAFSLAHVTDPTAYRR